MIDDRETWMALLSSSMRDVGGAEPPPAPLPRPPELKEGQVPARIRFAFPVRGDRVPRGSAGASRRAINAMVTVTQGDTAQSADEPAAAGVGRVQPNICFCQQSVSKTREDPFIYLYVV